MGYETNNYNQRERGIVMETLSRERMEEIEGGGFWSGCASGLSGLVGFGVISVGSLAVWQVAAIAAAGAFVAGGLDGMSS